MQQFLLPAVKEIKVLIQVFQQLQVQAEGEVEEVILHMVVHQAVQEEVVVHLGLQHQVVQFQEELVMIRQQPLIKVFQEELLLIIIMLVEEVVELQL